MAYRSRFSVQGLGKTTGRKRSRVLEAWDEAGARRLAEANEMGVERVERLPDFPPSESQIAYAKHLGIIVPDDASSYDVSDMINFHHDSDVQADNQLRALASAYGVEFGRFTGKYSLHYRIMNALKAPGREPELIGWFAYQVYLELARRSRTPVVDGPNHPTIRRIANELVKERAIMTSIRRYTAHDLMAFGEVTEADGSTRRGGSKGTLSFRKVSELLRTQLGTNDGNGDSQPSPIRSREVSASE